MTEREPLLVASVPAVRDVRWAVHRLIVLALVAAVYLTSLARAEVGRPDAGSALIFFRLFYLGEPLPVVLLAAFAAFAWWSLSGAPRADSPPQDEANLSCATTGSIALAVVALVAAVAIGLLKESALSMDEFGAVFQARLLATGRVAADVPLAWRAHLDAITPVFILARPADSAWVSSYLPGNAAIRAPFERAGIGWISGAFLAAVCVIAISGVSRRLWPKSGERQLIAVGALALSTQFLVVAGTPYAMTAHLAVNLCWLYVWVRGGRVAFLAGPIGILGVLIHQPVPHLLFAAPFGLRLLRERRWRLLVWMGLCYILALLLSSTWHDFVGFGAATGGLAAALAAPKLVSWYVAVMHVVLLLTWQTPLAALSTVLCLRHVRSLRPVEQDLLGGLVLSLVFYLFFKLITQGHGWGWRYGHQALGNVALLCATSWPTIQAAFGASRARRLAVLSSAVTILGQFPARARLVHSTAAPFANANRWLRTLDADVIVVPNDSIWYGRDLVRNEPGLPRPILVFGTYAADPARNQKPLPTGLTVRRVSVTELTAFGLEPVYSGPPDR